MTIAVDAPRQTLASFDWQWANLAQGDFMPGDPWFDTHAARVLARELCAIDGRWFVGKRVLDAGCGQGRWTRALLELGAEVTAVDYSEAGLERTRALCAGFRRLHTRRVNLLEIPHDLARERFDLVFSFGVLHHTGDTRRALSNIAALVDDAARCSCICMARLLASGGARADRACAVELGRSRSRRSSNAARVSARTLISCSTC